MDNKELIEEGFDKYRKEIDEKLLNGYHVTVRDVFFAGANFIIEYLKEHNRI